MKETEEEKKEGEEELQKLNEGIKTLAPFIGNPDGYKK